MKRNGDDNSEMIQAALEYARMGWKILVLHAKTKKPIRLSWADFATDDEATLTDLFEQRPGANIGLLLGERSGIIDIEIDKPEGAATAERLFPECYTPTYSSRRGKHRLFKWNRELPAVQKIDIEGLEIRIGGADLSTQSVLPPSKHPLGAEYDYRWCDGLSPSEVDVLDVPESVIALLANYHAADAKVSTKNGQPSFARETLKMAIIPEGERNERMFRLACMFARGMDVSDPTAPGYLLMAVDSENARKCKPPLGDAELKTIVASALNVEKRGQVERVEQTSASHSDFGLIFDKDEWWPGE